MRTCAYSKLDAALAFTCVILRCALFALAPWALMSGCESDLVLGQVPEQEEAPVEMPSSLTSWDDFRPVQLAITSDYDFADRARSTYLVATDVPGRLACLAAEDAKLFPANSGAQMWIMLYELGESALLDASGGCQAEEFVLQERSECGSLENASNVGNGRYGGCVVFRSWDEDDVSMPEIARSGLLTLSPGDSPGECNVDIELIRLDATPLTYSFVFSGAPVEEGDVYCSLERTSG